MPLIILTYQVKQITHYIIPIMLILILSIIILGTITPNTALAAGYHQEIDGRAWGYVKMDGTGDNSLQQGIYKTGISIVRILTNGVLLPMAIIFFIWKLIYIALFLVVIGKDPLDIKNRVNYNEQTSNLTIQKLGKRLLREESTHAVKWLLIVAFVFMIINFIIWLAATILSGVPR